MPREIEVNDLFAMIDAHETGIKKNPYDRLSSTDKGIPPARKRDPEELSAFIRKYKSVCSRMTKHLKTLEGQPFVFSVEYARLGYEKARHDREIFEHVRTQLKEAGYDVTNSCLNRRVWTVSKRNSRE